MSEPGQPPVDPVPDIPIEAIERWISLPPDKQLAVRLTKQDFDSLLLSIRTGIVSQTYIAGALQKLSQGNLDGANEDFQNASECIRKSMIWINALISNVMTNAVVVEGEDHG